MTVASTVDEYKGVRDFGKVWKPWEGAVTQILQEQPREGAAPAFVESRLETVAGSAVAAEMKSRGRPRARRLLRVLEHKKNILITTHLHPDPDALASCSALMQLLRARLPHAEVSMSIK